MVEGEEVVGGEVGGGADVEAEVGDDAEAEGTLGRRGGGGRKDGELGREVRSGGCSPCEIDRTRRGCRRSRIASAGKVRWWPVEVDRLVLEVQWSARRGELVDSWGIGRRCDAGTSAAGGKVGNTLNQVSTTNQLANT